MSTYVVTWGSGAVIPGRIKHNYLATTDPGSGDDSDDGYSAGSDWLNTTSGAWYRCRSAGVGAAVWDLQNGAGGGGAPTDADYLVGTAQAGLSAEIVVGTTPGGELGGTWASPTVDSVHSGSAHHSQSHGLIHADHPESGLTTGHVVRATGATTYAFGAIQAGDLPAISHDTGLSDVSADDHHSEAHAVNSTGPHAESGLTAGHVLRATAAAAFSFGAIQAGDLPLISHDSGLSDVSPDDHHAQSHVLATGTALGPDHTISGAAAGEVLRALSATTAAFDVLAHGDLGSVGTDDHHAQAHAIDGGDHTGTLAHSALGSVTEDQHHARSHDHSAAGDGTTLSPATLNLPSSTTPAQTAEGQAVWDSDGDFLTIGTGAGRKDFGFLGSTTPDAITFGQAGAAGSSLETSRADHAHAMAADPVPAHEAAGDPHPGYRLESADHSHASTGLQGGTVSHDVLTGVSVDDHHSEGHVVDSTGPHTGSGLTAGHVLRATSATAFSFGAIAEGDLPGTVLLEGETPGGELGGTWASPTVDATHSGSAHHSQSHVLDGADHTVSGLTPGHVLQALTASTFGFAAPSVAGGDHGTLAGLGDDDHTLYILASGARAFTGTQTIRSLAMASDSLYDIGTETVRPANIFTDVLQASGSVGTSLAAVPTIWAGTVRSIAGGTLTLQGGSAQVVELAADNSLRPVTDGSGTLGTATQRFDEAFLTALDANAVSTERGAWPGTGDATVEPTFIFTGSEDDWAEPFVALWATAQDGVAPVEGYYGIFLSRGTTAAPAAVAASDEGGLTVFMHDGTDWMLSGSVWFEADSATPVAGHVPTSAYLSAYASDGGRRDLQWTSVGGGGEMSLDPDTASQDSLGRSAFRWGDAFLVNLDVSGTVTGIDPTDVGLPSAPSGELGGTWAATTVDSTHSGSAHSNVPTQTADLNMGGNDITNVADPTLGSHIGDRDYNDARYVQPGDAMTGDLGGTFSAATVDATHSGSSHANVPTQTGDLNMGTNDITNVGAVYATDTVVNVFTASGTWTRPTNPAPAYIVIEVVGGGGGAGGTASTGSGQQVASAGGGGGGYVRKTVDPSTLSSNGTVTVGSGGSGGAAGNNDGSNGTASSFAATGMTTLSADFGNGGQGCPASSGNAIRGGGAGGTTNTGGDYAVSGMSGVNAGVSGGNRWASGSGGSSGHGFGQGQRAGINSAGFVGVGYGAGGSGASDGPNSSAHAGGDGSDGIVIVTEYYA